MTNDGRPRCPMCAGTMQKREDRDFVNMMHERYWWCTNCKDGIPVGEYPAPDDELAANLRGY